MPRSSEADEDDEVNASPRVTSPFLPRSSEADEDDEVNASPRVMSPFLPRSSEADEDDEVNDMFFLDVLLLWQTVTSLG